MKCRNMMQACALVVLLLIEVRSSLAATEEDVVKYCLASVKSSRARIQSGELIATGKMTGKEPNSTKTIPALPVELHVDFDSQKLRFERKEGGFDGIFVRDQSGITTYAKGDEGIVKDSLDSTRGRRMRSFDIRSLGLLSLGELETAVSAEQLWEFLKDRKVTSIVEAHDDAGIYILSWVTKPSPTNELKRTYWIDSLHGFTPMRMEVRSREHGTPQWKDAIIANDAEVTWKSVDNVWIPVRCRMSDAFGTKELTLDIDWKIVNGKVPAEAFEIAAPGGTYVVDGHLEKPIVEGVIGKGLEQPDPSR
jgi:hypothetical protein